MKWTLFWQIAGLISEVIMLGGLIVESWIQEWRKQ